MKKTLQILWAAIFLISQSGVDIDAAARTKKKTGETGAAPKLEESYANSPVELKGVTVEEGRLKVALSRLAPFKTFFLQNPYRLVVELSGTINKSTISSQEINGNVIQRVRIYEYGKEPSRVSRVVLDLSQPVNFEAHPAEGSNIVVDLRPNANLGQSKLDIGKWDLLSNLPTDRIDLDFEGDDVRNALRLLAELSGINIIYGPEISGPLTLHLKQVPFNQTFQTVLSMNNLTARQLGDNILWIQTPATLTQSRAIAPLSTRTFVLNYAKADSLKTLLDQMRGASGRKGSTMIDSRTNALVIVDTSEGLEEADRTIHALDKKPKQIMIEAKVVEIAYNDALDLGVRWEALYNNTVGGSPYGLGSSLPGLAASAVPFAQNGSQLQVNQNGVPVSPNSPGSRGAGVNLPASNPTGEITFGFVNNSLALANSLSILASKDKSRTLSEPRILTLNSEPAHIDSSQQVPYNVTTTAPGGTTTTSQQFVNVGIILDVTPTVNSKNQVTLNVAATVSSAIQNTLGGSQTPIVQGRNAKTTMLVEDGQTVAIGGLISQTNGDSVSKIPILGDIPILGVFFRHKSKSTKRTQLIAFITPRIVKD